MKKLMLVVLVMLAMVTVNALATVIPLVNGDFETAEEGWVTAPTGWTNWSSTAGFVYPLPLAVVCPDGGATAIFYSGATNVNSSLVFAQVTNQTIVSGQTYTVAANIGTEDYYTVNPQYPIASVNVVIYALDTVTLAANNIAAITVTDADFSANFQWKILSASYVADSTYAGRKLGVYVQFVGKDFGPWIDSVRLDVVPEPATMALLMSGMFGMLLKKRRNA